MRKFSFLFAFFLSVMGVTQAWAAESLPYEKTGKAIYASNSGWDINRNQWNDQYEYEWNYTTYYGIYDLWTENNPSIRTLISPEFTRTTSRQIVTISGYDRFSSTKDFTITLKLYYSTNKTDWTLIKDLSQDLDDGVSTDVLDIKTEFRVDKNYYLKLECGNVYLTNVKVEELSYTLAGAFKVGNEEQASFFGTTWDPTNEANEMVLGSKETTYTKVYKNVVFPSAGTIEYKVVKNNSWNVASWPSDNATCNIANAGKYDITFYYFVGSSSPVQCHAVEVKDNYTVTFENNAHWNNVYAYAWKGDRQFLGTWPGTKMTEKDGVYTITFSANDAPEKIMFAESADGAKTEDFDFVNEKLYSNGEANTYTATIKFTKDSWEKVYAYAWSGDGETAKKYLGAWPGTELTANADGTFTATITGVTAPEKIIFNDGSDEHKTGDLTFTNEMVHEEEYTAPALALSDKDTENKVATGTYNVSLTFTLGAEKFAAICLPFATTTTDMGEGVKAWAFTGYENGNINLTATTELAAATPYVIYAANGLSAMTFNNVTIASTEAGKAEFNGITFQGTYTAIAAGGLTGKYGVTPTGKIQKAGSGASMRAFCGYFDGLTSNAKLMFDGEEATGIDAINAAEQGGEMFDLQGRRVSNAQKGIYIQNGKKFVVK